MAVAEQSLHTRRPPQRAAGGGYRGGIWGRGGEGTTSSGHGCQIPGPASLGEPQDPLTNPLRALRA